MMLADRLREFKSRMYRRSMSKSTRKVEPVRQIDGIEHWAGCWIAVKDGEVIEAAHTSRELVRMVLEKGEAGRGAVAQFVPPHTDDIVIGVG